MLAASLAAIQQSAKRIGRLPRTTLLALLIVAIIASLAAAGFIAYNVRASHSPPGPPHQQIPLAYDSAADESAWHPRGPPPSASANPTRPPRPLRPFFVVVSPESHGNRYLVSLLTAAGCYGRSSNAQPFDVPPQRHRDWPNHVVADAAGNAPCAAMHRSVPHAGVWLNVSQIDAEIREAGWEPRYLVSLRADDTAAFSQVVAGHAPTLLRASDTIISAQQLIVAALPGRWFRFVLYDQLAHDHYRQWLFAQHIGRPLPSSAPAFKDRTPAYFPVSLSESRPDSVTDWPPA
jgi:hypothetical protein